MKYKVYYGPGGNTTQNKIFLAEFDSIKGAEDFIKKDIEINHKPNYYLRITYVSQTCRWYDYGSHFKFYLITGKLIKTKSNAFF